MEKTFKTTGIVLKRRDYQEYDRLFSIYTKDFGKIELLGKGTKKIISKLNSHMELFNMVRLMGAKGKGFDKLAGSNVIEHFSHLRNSVIGIAIASYILEVTDYLIGANQKDEEIFNLLTDTLTILNEIETLEFKQARFIAHAYVVQLLAMLGYAPEVYRCIQCYKGILLPKNTFHLLSGGLICTECKNISPIEKYLNISDEAIHIIRNVLEKHISDLVTEQAPDQAIAEFNQLVEQLVLIHTDRELKSKAFLKSLKKK